MKKSKKVFKNITLVFLIISFIVGSNIYISKIEKQPTEITTISIKNNNEFSADNYKNEPYIVINNNIPEFSKNEITTISYEKYGELDYLGRCTYAIACIGNDIMPTTERESISSVKPTGWHSVQYDCIDQNYLYNRCHLIAYQLSGENANEKNLITGTRYMNVEGMLPFENEIAEYVKATNNHVIYRVTPFFNNVDLVAQGVHMEAFSVEDNGKGIQFNVFCYNVQPDITIDYATGNSYLIKGG